MSENQNDMANEDITSPTQTEGASNASAMNTDAGQVESHTNADLEIQKENSRLGRKVARLEGTIAELSDNLRSFLAQSQGTQQSDIPEYITTADDVEKILSHREQKIQAEQQKYESEYKFQLNQFSGEETLHQEIVNEMMANFNVKRTSMGRIDAEINYNKAKASLLSKKMASPRPNVKSENSTATALGVSGKSDVSTPKTPVKLDPVAEKFAKYMGMTDDQIRNALS
jgi:hypothetical protein